MYLGHNTYPWINIAYLLLGMDNNNYTDDDEDDDNKINNNDNNNNKHRFCAEVAK